MRKQLLVLLFAMIALFGINALVCADPLPFGITVDGQQAAPKPGTPFAQIVNPVPNNAKLVVNDNSAMIIVNIHKLDAAGNPIPGAQPAIILLQGTNKTTLDKTMDKKKLAPGRYQLNVVASGKTALIHFTVK